MPEGYLTKFGYPLGENYFTGRRLRSKDTSSVLCSEYTKDDLHHLVNGLTYKGFMKNTDNVHKSRNLPYADRELMEAAWIKLCFKKFGKWDNGIYASLEEEFAEGSGPNGALARKQRDLKKAFYQVRLHRLAAEPK